MAIRSGWDNAHKAKAEADERSKKNGKFLSFENDGDKAVVAFVGEPTAKEIVWKNDKQTLFTKEDEAQGVQPQVKFSFNVFNRELKKIQIFEQGNLWFNELLACKKKYGLEACWFEIIRNGAKGDKNTRYKTLYEEKMTEDEIKMVREIEKKGELFDLEKEAAGEGKNDDKDDKKSSKSSEKSDAPISDKAKEMLVARLTDLPGSATKTFLAEFSIEKIRMLPQSAFDAAVSFIEKLEAEIKGGKGEVNPFE